MSSPIKSFFFKNQTLRQTVAKNTIWLGISNVGGRLLKVAIVIYGARLLGAAGWGSFSYALTLAALVTIFIDMGINSIMTTRVATESDDRQRASLISTALIIKLSLLLLGVLLIIFVAPKLTPLEEVQTLFPYIAFIFVFTSLREFGNALIHALGKMEYEAGLNLFTNLNVVVLGFLFLSTTPTVSALALAYAVGTGLGAVATLIALRQYFRKIFKYFKKDLIYPILTLAWPLAIAGLLGGLLINVDIFMIGWYRSTEDVGFYSAGQRIIQLFYVFPIIISASILPIFARLAKTEFERFRHVFENILRVIFLAAFPIAIGGIILSKQLVVLLFGQTYLAAATPFAILMLTMIIDFPAIILSNAIFAYSRQKKLIVYAAIGGFSNVALNFLLIPRFGIIGCAVATLITQIISNIYLWNQMKKINPFSIFTKLLKMISATIIMGIAVYALNVFNAPLTITILSGIVIYFGAIYAMREPLFAEIKSILKPL